jgi:hypothetical protein
MDAPAPAATSRESLRDFAILGGCFVALAAAGYLYTLAWSTPFPRDGTGLPVGRDFLNFWLYGVAALTPDPSRFYDPDLYNRFVSAFLATGYLGVNWSYPPTLMLLAVPFGQIPYIPALLLWTALGLATFLLVARGHGAHRRVLWVIALSPAAFFCLVSGQSAFFVAAAFLAIFSWLDRRPVAAGVLIGLLSLKPQLGLLFPIMLMASGRWRAFAAATLTALALAALAAVLFGPKVWADYVLMGIPTQNIVLADPQMLAAPFMPTVFMNLRMAGAGYGLAMAVQLGFAAAAAGAVIWAFRHRPGADPTLRAALFFACAVGASPYLLSYDTLPLAVAAVTLIAAGKLDAPGQRIATLVYWLPALQMAFGSFGIPGPALIAPAFALYLVARLHAAERPVASAVPAAA